MCTSVCDLTRATYKNWSWDILDTMLLKEYGPVGRGCCLSFTQDYRAKLYSWSRGSHLLKAQRISISEHTN
jgi:hypothetical protein